MLMEDKFEKFEKKIEKQMKDVNDKLTKVPEHTVNDTAFMKDDTVHEMGVFLAESLPESDSGVIDSGAPKGISGEAG